jgi:hypothetical protein
MALAHPCNQEATHINQGSEEAEYDERQFMFPFIKEEQRLETLAHGSVAENESKNSEQGTIVEWTKILAVVTGALAFATFIVAFVGVWSARDTARLADAARDQADIAMQTQKPQLRAYLGPTFASFRLTAHPTDCDPSTTTFSPDIDRNAPTIFCYHFKNYGHTPAKSLRICSDNANFIFADNGHPNNTVTVNGIITKCTQDVGLPSVANWLMSGEEREGRARVDQSQIYRIIESSNHGGFLFFMIKYYDVFGDRHHTYVCRGVIYPPSPGTFVACPVEVPLDD